MLIIAVLLSPSAKGLIVAHTFLPNASGLALLFLAQLIIADLFSLSTRSPTRDFFVDAAFSKCGRFISSPFLDSFRVLDASGMCIE